ncbi:GNAT family N-acetyltransferase [Paenibacillus sp. KN14-4R]|uniref:GNAT family N-acetyltransferase n=1 Tax=Paenibacillus sp. KN14-4R TaxID=3445773 RepID=UPI003FA047EF
MKSYIYGLMTEEYAITISNWAYPEPYTMYSMDGSEESISEFMNGKFYYVLNLDHELIGYICTGVSARVPGGYAVGIYGTDQYLDIGLGLKPEVTGSGLGAAFLTSGLEFLNKQFNLTDFQLVVAVFNERAIKVYERVGFKQGIIFKSKVREQDVDFVVMNYSIVH